MNVCLRQLQNNNNGIAWASKMSKFHSQQQKWNDLLDVCFLRLFYFIDNKEYLDI